MLLETKEWTTMKKPPPGTAERIAQMTFASVYPHYVDKVEKKGRTKKELHEVIKWLTGYDDKKLKSLIDDEATFGGMLAMFHGDDERVSEESVRRTTAMLERIVARFGELSGR